MPHILELHKQVQQFKHWIELTDISSDEWELAYEHWDDLCRTAINTITVYQNGAIPIAVAKDLIFVLARDHESEYIRENLVDAPKLVSELAKIVLGTSENDAKWQIAISIAESNLHNAAELLRPFLADDDEYVRRRSLMAIAPFAPAEAEAIALNNLEDPFEYTRISALHVLHTVRSPHLTASLDWLASDANKYVRQNVQRLRIAQNKT